MNARERWNRVFHFQPVDRIPDYEFGYWKETFTTWHKQGLPSEIDSNDKAERFFGFDRRETAPVAVHLIPGFQPRIIEEDESHRIIVNEEGVRCVVNRDGSSSIPKYLEFPLKNRDDWKWFQERLNPETPRYPENWEQLKIEWQSREYPLGLNVGSLFGCIRNWMGFEGVALACYDDPDLIEEIMEYLTTFILDVTRKAVMDVQFDFALFWEDMAFNHGPIISPTLFARLMVPRYRRITDFLKQHGVDVVIVDCDGNINGLVEHWLGAGVNVMFPLEIRGGSDPYPMRGKFGRNVLLLGGVDKTKLAEGKDAIRRELKRLEPLVSEGGFIPHVDHRCPPDVTYDNYRYYLKTKREVFGIPHTE